MAIVPSSQIVMRAKLEELTSLEHWVATQAVEHTFPPPLARRIDLCLTEHATNIIDYGYANRAPGTIIMSLWHRPEEIVVRIDDDGAPFDPTSYALPALPRSLADAKDGGRGIRLVRHFADELHYLRTAAGNELLLKFRMAPAPR